MAKRGLHNFAAAVALLRSGPCTVFDLAVDLNVTDKVVRSWIRALRQAQAVREGAPIRQGSRGCLSRTWFIP